MGTLEELIGMTTGDDTVDDNVTFVVEDSTEQNNSVVHLSPVTMDDLNIWYGVAILLEGNKNRKAVCTVLTDENCGENKIRMNEVVRNKFGVSVGDSVTLGSFLEIPKGRKIVVRPIREGGPNCDFVQENLFESYLRPYFFGANRPVNNGDVFSVKGRARTIQFKVVKVLPSPFCIVGPATIIHCEEQKVANKPSKKDSAGVSKKVKRPQIALQSSRGSPVQTANAVPVQNDDALLVQNADTLPVPTVDKLPAPTIDELSGSTVDTLVEPPIDKLRVTITEKLPKLTITRRLSVQNVETSSEHQSENEVIEWVVESSEASEPVSLKDKIELAHSLQSQGNLKQAIRAFMDVIKLQKEKLGRSHPAMLPIKQTLAKMLCDLKRFEAVTQMFLSDQQLINCWDPSFLDTKFLIAVILIGQQKHEEAVGILSRALGHVTSVECSFLEKLKIKVLLACVFYCQNKWKSALELLSDKKTLRGPRFPNKIEKFLFVLNKLSEHEELQLHSLYVANPDALIIKYHVAWFYNELEDYILANQIVQEILPFMKESMGSDHLYCSFTADLLKNCKEQMLNERERQLY